MSVSLSFAATVLRQAVVPALLALAVLVPSAAEAQLSLPPDYAWRQFSPPGEAGSSVRFLWKMDPRGEWVVFVGDVENTGAEAVYSRSAGTAPALHRLSAYGARWRFRPPPELGDGRFVLYRGDLETAGLERDLERAALRNARLRRQAQRRRSRARASPSSIRAGGRRPHRTRGPPRGRGFWSVPVAGPAGRACGSILGLTGDELSTAGGRSARRRAFLVLIYNAGRQTSWASGRYRSPDRSTSGVYLLDSAPTGCFALVALASPGSNRVAYS